MRWKDGRRSDNVEDKRGQAARVGVAAAAPLVLRFLPGLMRSKTGRTLLIGGVIVIFGSRLLGIDILGLLSGGSATGGGNYEASAQEEELKDFLTVVLAETEDTWHRLFAQEGLTYREPTLVFFTDRVESACGLADSAVGPFYCPGDQKLYIDMSFFYDLARRHGAPGDFAQAYVLAHEVGHHVQTLTGISAQVQKLGRGKRKAAVNDLSVRQELQADCLAGIWAHYQERKLEPGDLREALTAATAIGDDRLQREAGRRVVPDSFTHGSSEQRARWFSTGLKNGQLKACDTFSARDL
jgi:predicted metalloprotease